MSAARNSRSKTPTKGKKSEPNPSPAEKPEKRLRLKGDGHFLHNQGNSLSQKLGALTTGAAPLEPFRELFTERTESNTIRLGNKREAVFIHNQTMYDLARFYTGLKYVQRHLQLVKDTLLTSAPAHLKKAVESGIDHLLYSTDTYWDAIEKGELEHISHGPISLGVHIGRNSTEPDQQEAHIREFLFNFCVRHTDMRLLNGRPKDPARMSEKEKLLNCEHFSLFEITSKDQLGSKKATFPAGPDGAKQPAFDYSTKTAKISHTEIANNVFRIPPATRAVCNKIHMVIDEYFDGAGSITTDKGTMSVLKCLGGEPIAAKGTEGLIASVLQFSPRWLQIMEAASPIKESIRGQDVDVYIYSSAYNGRPKTDAASQHRWFNMSPVFLVGHYSRHPMLKKTLLLPGSANTKMVLSLLAGKPISASELASFALMEHPIRRKIATSTPHRMSGFIASAMKSTGAENDGDLTDHLKFIREGENMTDQELAEAIEARRIERAAHERKAQEATKAKKDAEGPAASGADPTKVAEAARPPLESLLSKEWIARIGAKAAVPGLYDDTLCVPFQGGKKKTDLKIFLRGIGQFIEKGSSETSKTSITAFLITHGEKKSLDDLSAIECAEFIDILREAVPA